MDTLHFEWCTFASPLFEEARAVRRAVFVEEQGFSLVGEFDDTDRLCQHVVALLNGRAVGTARMYPEGQKSLHIGRLALLAACRGQGLGAAIMEEIYKKAKADKQSRLVLNAQADKTGFYKKLGYVPTGKTSLDEGCPHCEMARTV